VAGSVEFHEEVTLETQLATGITLAIRILKAAQTGGDVGDALSGFIEGEVPTEVREWLRGTAEVLYEGIRDGEQVGFSVAMLTSVAMALSGVADQCGGRHPSREMLANLGRWAELPDLRPHPSPHTAGISSRWMCASYTTH
jgi:hypothetical protein